MPSDMTTNLNPDLPVAYNGTKKEMFSLAFKTGMLTIVTFGIYRFWQKTRLRRYIWSRANVGGDTFEYTGTGLEKLLGFLVAIVFLAVYLGIIQMVLFFFGMNIMVDPENASPAQVIGQILAIYISFFAVLPFLLFAVYRARRYKLARTRWRGIRFAMDKGAWGYVWRAIGHGLLTLITLGIMLPRQTYYLEKYMTDRSHFGSAKFEQNGEWKKLYPAMKHIAIGFVIIVLAVAAGATENAVLAGILGVVGYIWMIVGSLYYSVHSFKYLTNNKTLEDVRFNADPSTGTVISKAILGAIIITAIMAAAAMVFGLVMGLFGAFAQEGGSPVILIFIGLVGYLTLLVLAQALSLVFITQPILAHYIDTLTVLNPEGLNTIHQREADSNLDADGFADALDIGGAI